MSTYKNTYCPYCKHSITFFQRSEAYFYDRYIGLKYERCPNCKKIYSTNKKLYYQMNQHERDILTILYPLNIFFKSFTWFAIILCVVFLIAGLILEDNLGNYINQIWLILALLFIPCIITGIILGKKEKE